MKSLFTFSFITAFIFSATTAFTQPDSAPDQVSNVFKLNFFSPGISYEQKLLPLSTLNMDAYMDALLLSGYETSNNQFHVYFTPSARAEARTYYNLHKRNEKGLRTAMNSANYFAPLYMGRYTPISGFSDHIWINQLGAVWGIQRNAPKGFSLDVNTGLVYTFNAQTYYFYDPIQLVIQLRLGFWMGRKSK